MVDETPRITLPLQHHHHHDHHHHYPEGDEVPPWAHALGRKLDLILKTQEVIMTALSDLQAAVAAEDTEIASVITFLNGLPAAVAAAIAAAGTDPAALAAISTDIAAQTAGLVTSLQTASGSFTPPATPQVKP